MVQSSLTEQMITSLQTYGEPADDPRPRLWFRKHARVLDGNPTPSDYPMFFNTYFLNNLPPTVTVARQGRVQTAAEIDAIEKKPIWFDVDCIPLHIKGTYTIDGDDLNAEVGLLAAPSPEAYTKLGELKGNPSKGPVTAKFDKNPDFYFGTVSLRIRKDEELAGVQTLGVFGGILATVDWKGLGIVIAKRDIEVVQVI